jgi:hypothetical protein
MVSPILAIVIIARAGEESMAQRAVFSARTTGIARFESYFGSVGWGGQST